MDTSNNDEIFSGTKKVAENLKFNEAGLKEWFGDCIHDAGNIIKIEQY